MATKKTGASAPKKTTATKKTVARPAPAKKIPAYDVVNPKIMANGKPRPSRRSCSSN